MNAKTPLIDKRQIDSNPVQTPALSCGRHRRLFVPTGFSSLERSFKGGARLRWTERTRRADRARFSARFDRVLSVADKQGMPWRGKTFRASQQRGDNIFTKDPLFSGAILQSPYRGFVADGPRTYRALPSGLNMFPDRWMLIEAC